MASNLSARRLHDQTVRQIIVSSVGGAMVRVRLSNAFGATPVHVAAASIAVQRWGAELVPGTLAPAVVRRDGRRSPSRSAGGVASDPVVLHVRPGTHLAVSLYLRAPERARRPSTPRRVRSTGSPPAGARWTCRPATSSSETQSWYLLSGVDVLAPRRDRGAVVALGDSITDGVGAPLDANARYPNDLARRFAARGGATLSVVDEGIGGNRVLNGDRMLRHRRRRRAFGATCWASPACAT